MKPTKSIAFILGRKNSKRFKSKNTKKLGKYSLVEHSIRAVRNSNCFDRIIQYSLILILIVKKCGKFLQCIIILQISSHLVPADLDLYLQNH